ncbi:MAG: PorV/PorQ family protein [Melioribacteraceae bacterium]|nr:PorV/PorQ family protein [Melioribacteraceae bacterium]
MIKKIILTLFCASTIFAQSAGNTGVSFLKLGFGARNIALSDLGVVGTNDLSAAYYNPAYLSYSPKTQISFTHNSLFSDLNSEILGSSFQLFGLNMGLILNTTSINDIEVRNVPGDALTKISANYFAGGLSAGFGIAEKVHIGATYKVIYESLFSDQATGYAFDFGAMYSGIIENMNLGITLRNIGSMNQLRNKVSTLPSDLRIGLSYNFNLPEYFIDLAAIGGFQKYLEQDESHFHVGAEALYDKMFAARLGFASGYDSKSITTGFGIIYKGLNIDYAYVPFKYGLGDSHIFTFIYTF